MTYATIDWNALPDSLQAFAPQIQATAKSSIEMNLQPAEHLKLWQSKVGGVPYLPIGVAYPQNAEGQDLQLLAQINFAELPANDVYPATGILQFFINPHDDLYGLDFDNQQLQDGFRVIYHEVVTEDPAGLQQIFPDLDTDDGMSPVVGQYAVQFSTAQHYIDINDFAFAEKVTDPFAMEDEEGEAFCDEYSELFSGNGHRLGGYPFFTQTDPREYQEEIQDYVLLLQIDTDNEGAEIMWGDSGVGNFFIHPDDLKKRDFSKVLYNWDCC